MNHHCNMQVALKDNQIVKIQDIERGKNCNCICPACGSPLIARKGNVNIWHFSHINGSNCTYGYQTSLHLLAKDIFTKIIFMMNTNKSFKHILINMFKLTKKIKNENWFK